jgi:hypothetical protein
MRDNQSYYALKARIGASMATRMPAEHTGRHFSARWIVIPAVIVAIAVVVLLVVVYGGGGSGGGGGGY